jgi:protein tyrosine phosphatase
MNNYIYDNDIVEVFPHLYISNWYTSNNILELKNNNIKAVITVETRDKPDQIIDDYKNNNIDFKYLFAYDVPSFPIDIYFDDSYEFIDKHIKNGDNVLVHCYAGISRSATIILNYIIRKIYEYNNNKHLCPCYVLNYGLNIVKNKRDIINPNTGFIKQLLQKTKHYYKNKFSLK